MLVQKLRKGCLSSYHFTWLSIILSSLYAGFPVSAADTTHAWNAQLYGFVSRYHTAIDYSPGAGMGLAVEYELLPRCLTLAAGMDYTRATQALTLIGGSQHAFTRLYHSFLAADWRWYPLRQSRVALTAGIQIGLLFLRPQPLTLITGTAGLLELQPPAETKFVPAFGGGVICHAVHRIAVLFRVKQNFMRIEERQVDARNTTTVWRPYWRYEAGLSYSF